MATNAQLLAELSRVRMLFQARAMRLVQDVRVLLVERCFKQPNPHRGE